MSAGPVSRCLRSPILWLGLLAFLSVAIGLDVSDECSWTGPGPGLTFDENLNTVGGVYVVESVAQSGLAALDPRTLSEIFNSPSYFPDYPPLGRLPLGVSNAVLGRIGGLGEHSFYLVTNARLGSAITFGLLITLITWWTGHWAGTLAGIVAGFSLWITPRVFGHAHLASVETTMNLTYTACVLFSIDHLTVSRRLRPRDGLVPGILLGLALLTKIQAIFLPPLFVIWLLGTRRLNGVLPLLVIAGTSAAVFFLGWPWLWSDPLTRGMAYFLQTTDRAVLYCYYFGERSMDRAVPWHYPFVMFLMTTPLSALLLGGWGLKSAIRSARQFDQQERTQARPVGVPARMFSQQLFLLGAFLLPLMVFALPGVPVYDGERLFLVVWPIFSIWTGVGGQELWNWLKIRTSPRLQCIVAVLVIMGPVGQLLLMQPAWLSYYGVQVGGLRGAAALGMERNYWGDAVTPQLLRDACEQIPRGSTLGIAPVLHPLIPRFMATDSWLVHRPDLQVVAYDDKSPQPPRYVLWIHRRADPWQSLEQPSEGTRSLARITREGVVLAEVLELPEVGAVADQTP